MTASLLVAVCVLVVVAGVILCRVRNVLCRVEDLLTLVEKHGTLTDNKVKEITDQAQNVARTVVATVKGAAKEITASVPTKVVEEFQRAGPPQSHGDSGIISTGT